MIAFQTHQYKARWIDSEPDSEPFAVEIARLDIPEVYEAWHALTEEEQEAEDDYVFYFVNTTEEFEDLYTMGSGDFYLVKEND